VYLSIVWSPYDIVQYIVGWLLESSKYNSN